jgi:hypothetical protein
MRTHLCELLKEVGEHSRDDSSVVVPLCPTRDGKRLAGPRLPVREDCPVVTFKHRVYHGNSDNIEDVVLRACVCMPRVRE